MTLKKLKIISSISIFLLCFLLHFSYQWLPNPFFAIIAPVNESIWEHMKLIFTATILWSIIEIIILKRKNIKFNNYFISVFTSSFLSIPIYLIIFLPIYHKMGDSMFINITIMGIVIIFTQIISYFILKAKEEQLLNYISVFLIILIYIIFGYLTYNAPHNYLFFDTQEEKYGINNYNV